MITLYHHPYSRAAGTVWTLEEIGEPYKLEFVDIMKGGQKSPEMKKLNPMGKLPTLVDGDVVVTENAAIAMYLADRYSSGKLAPAPTDPKRGAYLRWSCFAPSVIEPGLMAKQGGWDYKPVAAGWGTYEELMDTLSFAIEGKDYLLGSEFSIADIIFGGTVRFMMQAGGLKVSPAVEAYVKRLGERPALKRADAKNAAVMTEHGIKPYGT